MIEYRKLIVLDLDDTLWKGIVSEEYIAPLTKFQRALKDLQERGVMLALCSKNVESIALEGFVTPGMVLLEDDFVARRINLGDKAENIRSLTQELRVGLQSVVFIDDSPFERGRVKEALPEVLVPDWPAPVDDDAYVEALEALSCFDTSKPTEEDLMRTQMYERERERAKSKSQSSTLEDWLKTLGTQLVIEPLNEENFPRTLQLLNKTNQMNLSTRRLSEAEFREWTSTIMNEVYTFKVSDRFGDAGLTGILSVTFWGDDLIIKDFVLSCRVMGRLVEEAMIAYAIKLARDNDMPYIRASYEPTPKNAPCLEFWQKRSGFTQDGNVFRLKVAQ